MKKISLPQVLDVIKCYFFITLGLLCYVTGWEIFLIPNNMVGGGVTGVSAIFLYAFNIPISVSFFVLNTILLLIALKVLGKAFGFKTVYAIIAASLFFQIVPGFIPHDFIQEIAISNGKLLCAIFGGVMSGFGIGICFAQGGSTGGTDIIALMVTKYRNISPGRVILYIDIFIIASSLLIPAKDVLDASGAVIGKETWGMRLATVLYGYLLIGASSYTVDMFLAGSQQSLQALVFSKKYVEIADAITSRLGRGVSVIDSTGWYTKQEGKLLVVIIHKTDTNTFYKIIREIDKEAFVSVTNVSGVYGRGFQQIKK
jgi:uncharacterized membrane-anchored protein YitT (DUF2179 family)